VRARAEAVDANALVVAAYAGFLVAFFGYIVHVVRRQAVLSKELAELAAKLEKRP
jgi:short subunit fatty acids transporter